MEVATVSAANIKTTADNELENVLCIKDVLDRELNDVLGDFRLFLQPKFMHFPVPRQHGNLVCVSQKSCTLILGGVQHYEVQIFSLDFRFCAGDAVRIPL